MPQAPRSPARLAAIVVFSLSCFGLLLFLWVSFGGSIPLKPKGYRFQVAFPEATQLATQADVRISGVSVGRVVRIGRAPEGNRALATVELQPRYAPLPRDTRAILRQKTLLGETYVELTPGHAGSPAVAEGGRLADARVQRTVEFDEILNTFDPRTRRAFRTWQQQTGAAVRDAGPSLNGALGELPGFLRDGGELLGTLDTEKAALSRLVRDTGTVFAALTQREDQLHRLITATDDVFATTARRDNALAQAFSIFPTFLRESQATFRRTQSFAAATGPVVRALRPPTRDLGPTIHDVRDLVPDLRTTLLGVRDLTAVSRTGLPATSQVLQSLRPALARFGPFLSEVNPLLQYLEQNQYMFGDFITLGAGALRDTLPTQTPGSAGHYLRQFGVNGIESAGVFRERLPSNRGNAYPKGAELASPDVVAKGIGPQWDCVPSGGERDTAERGRDGSVQSTEACWVAPPSDFQRVNSKFPRPHAADYRGGGDPGGVSP